jgi:integrase
VSTNTPAPFTSAELDALVAASPCLWWRAFVELSAATGLRVQEALRLHASDVCERTLSVRVTSDPVDAFGDTEHVTLRRWHPPHQERTVPVPSAVIQTLTRLRSERPDDSHVFIPDWKLDQLWPRLVSQSPVTSDNLCPRLASWFRMIQRRARLVLARSFNRPLADISWSERTIGSLRVTAAFRLAETLTPEELATRLGCPTTKSVAAFYRRPPKEGRGAA